MIRLLLDRDHGNSPVIATNLHMKRLPDAVFQQKNCVCHTQLAQKNCQAPEETQLQVKLLKAELQDQVPGTGGPCGRSSWERICVGNCADGATPK